MKLSGAALAVFLLLGAGPVTVSSPSVEDNWPQFRGPDGSARIEGPSPPTSWTKENNVAWVAEIPGRGWSSPIVWGDKVFLTAAINVAGEFKEPSTGIYGNDYAAELASQGLSDDEVLNRVVARDIELSSEAEDVRYMVYALDAESGAIVWERSVHEGKPFGGRHRKNTYASETPATDGERLYVYFGNVGLFALSLESGSLAWRANWEPEPIYLDFGTASSPIVHGDRVYVQNDNQKRSFLAAIDKTNGREVWRVPRGLDDESMIRSGWATPFVWENETRTEIVAVGHSTATSYSTDGRELWRLSGLSGQATPTPLAGGGLLFVGTGSQGESNRPMFAVRPGASGDISLKEGETSNAFVQWFEPRASAYTSSPLFYEGRLYVVNDNGILSTFDAKTGERLYRARVGGGGFTFSASPWAYDGQVFYLSEDGDVFATKAGPTYEELWKVSLGEMSLASPAIAGASLYVRTQTKLYCIR